MWPDAGVEQEKRRVKDPWEAVLANMPEVVEKKRWDKQDECYVVTEPTRSFISSMDQERVASEAILTHVLEVPIAHQTTAAHDAARERDEDAGLGARPQTARSRSTANRCADIFAGSPPDAMRIGHNDRRWRHAN